LSLRAKVLTVSDGVIAGTRDDKSGAALVERLSAAGYEVVDRRAVADGVDSVAGADVFVAGSAIFHADDPLEAARRIRKSVA